VVVLCVRIGCIDGLLWTWQRNLGYIKADDLVTIRLSASQECISRVELVPVNLSRHSSVSIATSYGLDDRGSIPGTGRDFSGTNSASHPMSTGKHSTSV
jgi:hypothetical protein